MYQVIPGGSAAKAGENEAMALKSIGDLGSSQAMTFMQSVKSSSTYDEQMIRLFVDLYI